MPPFDDVKIFGERNTSTNALKVVIEFNSRSRVLPSSFSQIAEHFGLESQDLSGFPPPEMERIIDARFADYGPLYAWKHAAPRFTDPGVFADCLVLLTFRHPASWLLALHRNPYHTLAPVPSDFCDFLRAPWYPLERDLLGGATMTPMELYNRKAASGLDFARRLSAAGQAHALIRFEDFARDQVAVLEDLRHYLLEPLGTFVVLDKSTKDPRKDRLYYQDYYGRSLWVADITDEAERIIHAGIDWNVARELDYWPLSTVNASKSAHG